MPTVFEYDRARTEPPSPDREPQCWGATVDPEDQFPIATRTSRFLTDNGATRREVYRGVDPAEFKHSPGDPLRVDRLAHSRPRSGKPEGETPIKVNRLGRNSVRPAVMAVDTAGMLCTDIPRT